MLLDDILIKQGKVTAEQVRSAKREQGDQTTPMSVGDALVEAGILSQADLLAALSELFDLDVIEAIDSHAIDPSLIGTLPVEWARTHVMLPIRHQDDIKVVLCDPTQLDALDDLALLLGDEITPLLAPRQTVLRAIEQAYFDKGDTAQDFIETLESDSPRPRSKNKRSDDLLRVTDEAPVTQLVNIALLEALKSRASDVHVEPFENNLRIRFRIDGLLYDHASPPKHMEAALVSRLKVMAHMDIAEKRMPQDGIARVRVGEQEVDIRVSSMPVAEGERIVLRLLDRESTCLSLVDLGMPQNMLDDLRRLLREPQGMILVTGPTGSGKTTTLYAALGELDTKRTNVLTIEDPIEYQLPDIGQIQVKSKIGLTFSHGLRHVLRQDPDVILVGEIRDLETAEISVRAALTGHLVFSTLHTTDAPSAVVRLVDMGIPAYLLSEAINASLAQRLVRTMCPDCREAYTVDASELSALGEAASRVSGQTIWRPVGCDACMGGYRGRTGIYELMTADVGAKDAIRKGAGPRELRAAALGGTMRSLLDDGIDKILAGETSLDELLRVAGTQQDGPS